MTKCLSLKRCATRYETTLQHKITSFSNYQKQFLESEQTSIQTLSFRCRSTMLKHRAFLTICFALLVRRHVTSIELGIYISNDIVQNIELYCIGGTAWCLKTFLTKYETLISFCFTFSAWAAASCIRFGSFCFSRFPKKK